MKNLEREEGKGEKSDVVIGCKMHTSGNSKKRLNHVVLPPLPLPLPPSSDLLEQKAKCRRGHPGRARRPRLHIRTLQINLINHLVVRLQRVQRPEVVAAHDVVCEQTVDVKRGLVAVNGQSSG